MSRSGRAILMIVLCGAAPAAALVGGGGAQQTDCYTVFEGLAQTGGVIPPQVGCEDGDPACDADGLVDGSCTFVFRVCVNRRDLFTGCRPLRVDRMRTLGSRRNYFVLPALPETRQTCAEPSTIRVHSSSGRGRRLLVRVITKSARRPHVDRDAIAFLCAAPPTSATGALAR